MLEFQLAFQEQNLSRFTVQELREKVSEVLKTMESIKQSQAKTGGQLLAVMPDIEKDLNGRKHIKLFYSKQFRKKIKPANITKTLAESGKRRLKI